MTATSNNGNKPAYPTKSIAGIIEEGLTKREMFAMAAMQAIIPSCRNQKISLDEIDLPTRMAAKWAIRFADELLKQLES